MRYKREDFQIIFHDLDKFSVKVRKPFLRFFHIWVNVTYQEAEHTEDQLLIFDDFGKAKEFIESISY